MNRRKWENGGDFGKPMHELRLPCPADPPKKSAHRESEASRVKGGSNSHKQRGRYIHEKREAVPRGTDPLSIDLTYG